MQFRFFSSFVKKKESKYGMSLLRKYEEKKSWKGIAINHSMRQPKKLCLHYVVGPFGKYWCYVDVLSPMNIEICTYKRKHLFPSPLMISICPIAHTEGSCCADLNFFGRDKIQRDFIWIIVCWNAFRIFLLGY